MNRITDKRVKVTRTGVAEFFDILSGPVTLELFRYIGTNGGWKSEDLMTKLQSKPTRKMFYSNIVKLRGAGLITKDRSHYKLSGAGRFMLNVVETVENALKYKDTLQVIDSMNSVRVEHHKLIDVIEKLVDNPHVREVAYPMLYSRGAHK